VSVDGPGVDPEQPSPARMYDYSLGGTANFAVDRAAVEAVGEIVPEFRLVGLANRGFLVRAVETMAEAGVDQFIDIGSGIPTSPNVHEVAQRVHPDARIVYVDNDPVVLAYNQALRGQRPGVVAVHGDLYEPAAVVDHPEIRAHLDFERPIGLIFAAVLHFVRRDLGVGLVAQFRQALPPGSFIAISAACSDGMEPALLERLAAVYATATAPIVLRTGAEIEALFDGVDLLEPGLADVTRWRQDGSPLPIRILSGVGRVGPAK
jgi:SAM-dependent methyltransferase